MIEVPPNKVIVECSGGVVQVVWTPPGVQAVLVDWDDLGDSDTDLERRKEIVAETPELPWGSERYPYPDGVSEIDFIEVPETVAAGPRSRPSAIAERRQG